MDKSTIIITIAHLALFVYTRRKYVGKYKKAKQDLTNVEMTNEQLRIENKLLLEHINTFEFDENE